MRIFLDTEFSSFENAELISIGMISECGSHTFYAELPVDRCRCSDFVKIHVLPFLENNPKTTCSVSELQVRMKRWLDSFSAETLFICSDYDGDWQLFLNALGHFVSPRLRHENIYQKLDQERVKQFLFDRQLTAHHALNDARANRYAFLTSQNLRKN